MNTEILDIVSRDRKWWIYYGEKPLKTALGKDVCSHNERLIHHILLDLQLYPESEGRTIRPIDLFTFQKDELEEGRDFFYERYEKLSQFDSLIKIKTGNQKGPGTLSGLSSEMIPDGKMLQVAFWSGSGILRRLNSFMEVNIPAIEADAEYDHPVIVLFKKYYNQAVSEIKSAVNMLSFIHGGGIVLPVLLASGAISPSEYSMAIVAGGSTHHDLGPEPVYGGAEFPYKKRAADPSENIPERFEKILSDAVSVCDYLACFRDLKEKTFSLSDEIRQGENDHLEFKSTLRWDLKQGKTNPQVERACLKTICAFLNAAGGILLIGIRDDGSPEGIESDRFANEDKFLLHLWTLIKTSMGKDISTFIRTTIDKIGERSVCVVECSPSKRPVFLRQPGFPEEFFVRSGPGTAALDISEALKYIEDRF